MAGNKADAFFVRTPGDIAATRNRLSKVAPPARDLAAATPYRVVYPWWIEKPSEAQDFTTQDFNVALGAGAGVQAASNNILFNIPKGMVAVVQIFGIYILNQNAGTSVQFSLTVNGGAVPGWTVQNPPGIANIFAQNYSDLRVRLLNAVNVDIGFTNLNANGPWVVGGKLAGWFLSQTGVQRLGGDQY